MPQRPSNIQRALWRQKCRLVLAQHIYERTGTQVAPEEVRLITQASDLYSWSVLPDRAHLFTKQLSKLSVGIYAELIREVGKSFEAVSGSKSHTVDEGPTLSSRIDELETHNASLRTNFVHLQSAYHATCEKLKRSRLTLVRRNQRYEQLLAEKQKLDQERSGMLQRVSELEARNSNLQEQGNLALKALQNSNWLIN